MCVCNSVCVFVSVPHSSNICLRQRLTAATAATALEVHCSGGRRVGAGEGGDHQEDARCNMLLIPLLLFLLLLLRLVFDLLRCKLYSTNHNNNNSVCWPCKLLLLSTTQIIVGNIARKTVFPVLPTTFSAAFACHNLSVPSGKHNFNCSNLPTYCIGVCVRALHYGNFETFFCQN